MIPFAKNDYCKYTSYEDIFSISGGKQVIITSRSNHIRNNQKKHKLSTSNYKKPTTNNKTKKIKYTYKKKIIDDNYDNLQSSLNNLKLSLHTFSNNLNGIKTTTSNDDTLKNKDKKTRTLMINLKKVLGEWKKYNKQIHWNKKNCKKSRSCVLEAEPTYQVN